MIQNTSVTEKTLKIEHEDAVIEMRARTDSHVISLHVLRQYKLGAEVQVESSSAQLDLEAVMAVRDFCNAWIKAGGVVNASPGESGK